MNKSVIVTTADSDNLSRILKELAGKEFSWAYLNFDVAEHHRVKDRFHDKGIFIETTQKFHDTAEKLKEPYLTYLYEIGQELASLHWWISPISYRNGYVSKTIHQACYLRMALELIGSWESPEPLVLLVSRPVHKALQDNLSTTLAAKICWLEWERFAPLQTLKGAANMLAHRAYFILTETYRLLRARRSIRQPFVPTEPTTLLLSWVTPENLDKGGEFHKSFFGNLASKIVIHGQPVAIAPLILPSVNYKTALQRLNDSSFPLAVPHRYLNFWDLFKTVVSSIGRPPIPRSLPELDGMDVTDLVNADLTKHWISNGAAYSLMTSALVRRWAHMGFLFNRFVYIYENQPTERALCWQATRSFPGAMLVGYQHAGVPRLLLNFILAEGGEPKAPLPHRVITVGKLTAKILSAGGYEPGCIKVGGALQMEDMLSARSPLHRKSESGGHATVLIAPSDSLEEAAELVHLAGNLFDKNQDISVVVKCHPRMPFERVSAATGIRLPDHVVLSDKPISDLISESSVMVYSGSTVAIQALTLGLPVVHLRTQFELDLDPLGLLPHLRLEATGLEELREKVIWLLKHGTEFIDRHQVELDQLIDDFYGPVTAETYQAFIE